MSRGTSPVCSANHFRRGTAAKLPIVKSYHDQTMAEGVRVQIVVPKSLAEALRQRAKQEKRSLSALGAFLLETGLRSLPPLGPEAVASD